MTFTPTHLQKTTEPLWFCVKTQPKHEQVAAAGLRRNLGLQCFAPRVRFRKATARGPVYFVEAMFPGYVFARFHFAEFSRRVQSCPGVTTILRFGERVAVLSNEVVAELQAAVGDAETLHLESELRAGNEVRIADGPFQGLQAVIKSFLPSKDRVRVLLEFLGTTIEAEVAEHSLVCAD